ncbi:hypothetical protein RUM43_003584 [Polyplax serrata]|uniref:Enkurin domain-containing protein n=1 Tax=Polyplax serrata TaxID=468196 RepID=A0AAN8S9F1_POLSC
MLTTLNGMFSKPKPYKTNFIEENKKKVKERSMVNQNNNSRTRLNMTRSKNSQMEIGESISSSTNFKDRNVFSSRSRLSSKGSMAVFMQEKKDRGSTSNMSISSKKKSAHRVVCTKTQSCQTIDPRRCDQLFHEGIIKYPSNKVLQELAEIEKQKSNRLDVHVKKEFFKRNKVKHKSPKKVYLYKTTMKVTEKGDEGGEENPSEEEEEFDEEEENKMEEEEDYDEKENEESEIPAVTSKPKQSPPPLTMCAAEIIRKTTENINTPRQHHIPSSKGDSKAVKKSLKQAKDNEIMKTVLDPHCPPGHIPLPDTERKKTLHMLRVSHAELVREMNLLPVRADTLRVRQKKMQLEAQLNKIEEGIKVFNKSKVYVKIEE